MGGWKIPLLALFFDFLYMAFDKMVGNICRCVREGRLDSQAFRNE